MQIGLKGVAQYLRVLMLRPFNTVPHVVVAPTMKCKSLCFPVVLGDPCERSIQLPKGRDPQVENHWSKGFASMPKASAMPKAPALLTVTATTVLYVGTSFHRM